MADFTTTITDAGVIDADELTAFQQGIIFGVTPELVADQVATVRAEAMAKVIQFAKYANLSAATTALNDGEDVTSAALADSTATLTPAEHGNVVTLAHLANLESGGKAWEAAGFLIGRNAGTSLDALAITALEAFSTTVIYPNSATAASNLATTDNLNGVFANRLYNKLARTNVPGIAGGSYVGIAHDDCLHDLRSDTANGGWTDVSKYANPNSVLANEVGMYAGIRWLRSSNVTVTADSNGTIDSYKVNVVGFNALGKGESTALDFRMTGPFDKLGRFKNIGWYWVGKYGIIDTANMVQGIVASSVGAN